MNPASEDIKDMLEDSGSGTGLTFATDLFIAQMPSSPDKCVCVYDTAGESPGYNDYYKLGIQIVVRGDKEAYLDAYDLANTIQVYLHEKNNETWNSTRYIGVWGEGDILFMGWDDNQRPMFSINFRVHRSG